jgi:predicted DNA-binding transcriptional regulator AlpA
MPAVPKEQSAEHHRLGMQSRRKGCSPTSATPALRHGDRAGGGDDDGDDEDDDDDDAAARELPIFVRFGDIKAAGIATSWEQLYRLIDKQAFPVGVRLSPNVRAWRLDDIETWLDRRLPPFLPYRLTGEIPRARGVKIFHLGTRLAW